jgi:hypothetical protein
MGAELERDLRSDAQCRGLRSVRRPAQIGGQVVDHDDGFVADGFEARMDRKADGVSTVRPARR